MKHITAFLKSNLAYLFKLCMCVHVCSGAQSCPTFATLWTVAYQAPLSMEFPIRVSQVAVNAGDVGSISGSERSPGEGNGKPLQYFCLGNPGDRGACRGTVHRISKSRIWLNNWRTYTYEHTHKHTHIQADSLPLSHLGSSYIHRTHTHTHTLWSNSIPRNLTHRNIEQ